MESTEAKISFGDRTKDNLWTRCYRISVVIARKLSTGNPQSNNDMAFLLSKISDREFEKMKGVGEKMALYRKEFIERYSHGTK